MVYKTIFQHIYAKSMHRLMHKLKHRSKLRHNSNKVKNIQDTISKPYGKIRVGISNTAINASKDDTSLTKHLLLIPLAFALLSIGIVSCSNGGSDSSVVDLQMTDTDGDGYINLYDVDDDGDGLIEIMTVTDFNMIRNNLDGTGISSISGQQGETYGCGGGLTLEDVPITSCHGYELTHDISLIDYRKWQPIGSCSANNECEDAFNAVFEGNGYSISDMNIEMDRLTYGVGLFGAISPNSELRNVHVRNAMVVFEPAGEPYDVGILVGHGRGAYITGSSVVGGDIYTTAFDAGGLIGDGEGATITYSYANMGIIKGASEVGGLIGGGASSNILYSCASASIIDGEEEVGGLVGDGQDAMIISSYSIGDVARGITAVGGLAGEDQGINMKGSYVLDASQEFLCADMIAPDEGALINIKLAENSR